MDIDERLQAITMNLELRSRDHEDTNRRVTALLNGVNTLLSAVEKDSENIRALARIAELHEHRLTDLEGGPA